MDGDNSFISTKTQIITAIVVLALVLVVIAAKNLIWGSPDSNARSTTVGNLTFTSLNKYVCNAEDGKSFSILNEGTSVAEFNINTLDDSLSRSAYGLMLQSSMKIGNCRTLTDSNGRSYDYYSTESDGKQLLFYVYDNEVIRASVNDNVNIADIFSSFYLTA